jgi:hypothetical protein
VVIVTTKAAAQDVEASDSVSIVNELNITIRSVMQDTNEIYIPDTLSFTISSVDSENSTEPIIYFDGERQGITPHDIDPHEIDAITVFKGDAAFEKFGTEEARQRGVIMITSKSQK